MGLTRLAKSAELVVPAACFSSRADVRLSGAPVQVMACKGKTKGGSKVPSCAGCMEDMQEKHIDAMERRGERIRKPPVNVDPPARKVKKKRKTTQVVGKRVV